jgi:hypothetical protein
MLLFMSLEIMYAGTFMLLAISVERYWEASV